jgi:hypothetical protein
MESQRPGLHKQVLSIFEGLPEDQNKGGVNAPQSSTALKELANSEHADSNEKTAPQNKPEQPVKSVTKITKTPIVSAKNKEPMLPAALKNKSAAKNTANSLTQLKNKAKNRYAQATGRERIMMILIPILAIILAAAMIHVLLPVAEPVTPPKPSGLATGTFSASTEIAWAKPNSLPERIRDPMKAVTRFVAGDTSTGIVVRGIVYSEDTPTATIGKKIVTEGDMVYDAKVIKINPDSVEFLRDGQRWTQQVQR